MFGNLNPEILIVDPYALFICLGTAIENFPSKIAVLLKVFLALLLANTLLFLFLQVPYNSLGRKG